MSRKFATIFVCPLVLLATAGASAEPKNYKTWEVRAELTGVEVGAIQAATRELRKREPRWKNYSLEIVETDKSYVVEFWLPEHRQIVAFQDGTDSQHPKVIARFERKPGALVVELSKGSMDVVDVYYER